MKNPKLLIYSLFLVLTFSACTNKDNILDNIVTIEESDTMKRVVTELETHFDSDGDLLILQNPANNIIFDFCFDFVYPIELLYNNGTTVTVSSFQDLILVIINSTPELYIVGIEFPFDVQVYNPTTNEIEIITIHNEAEFVALLESCLLGNDCPCPNEYDPVCVEVEQNGAIITIQFFNACYAECAGFEPSDFVLCENDCQCPTEYDPVCVETASGEIIEFHNECYAICEGFTPNDFVACPADGCEISNLIVEVGDCNPDGTYSIVLDFDHINAGNDYFDVFVNFDDHIGTYLLSDLPVTIESFVPSGSDYDDLRVCINDNSDCCADAEWLAPNCGGNECDITNLSVDVGACNPDGTYALTLDFEHVNASNDFFDVFVRNNEHLGTFLLSDLPLTIENFELSGFPNDYLKVCINDQPYCCSEIEWIPPSCNTNECDITNLNVTVGDCNPTGSYALTINFDYQNPGNDFFDVYVRNDVFIGFYALADLPITIENFELSGLDYDFVKVCINDNPNCCEAIEWMSPPCNDCVCPQVFDPVCVEVGNTVVSYYNACYAECDGFTANDFVSCVNDCIDCANTPYDPVCVGTGGMVITYYNECFAFCDGFTPNDFVICD